MKERLVPTTLDFVKHKVENRSPLSLSAEVTARCNNDCRHCYINRPAGDCAAKEAELSLAEWERIAEMAKNAGVLWCLISGGEPMLRSDFFDLYLMFKKKGFLITLFTNATLMTPEAVDFFKRYPPYKVEVSVYGVTEETYVAVTGKPGLCQRMKDGIARLRAAGIYTVLKTPLICSNYAEAEAIRDYCNANTDEPFRFDTTMHRRIDFDDKRNALIAQEQLSDEQMLLLEGLVEERREASRQACVDQKREIAVGQNGVQPLFRCRAGKDSLTVDPYGRARLCSMLAAPEYLYDLKTGDLDGYLAFRDRILQLPNQNPEFSKCVACRWLPLCNWCPGRAVLACGKADAFLPDVCRVAEKRYQVLMEDENGV